MIVKQKRVEFFDRSGARFFEVLKISAFLERKMINTRVCLSKITFEKT